MRFSLLIAAAVCCVSMVVSSLHGQTVSVTTDVVTSADGRVQSSGVLGQTLFTAAENITTSRSSGNNVSDGLYEFDLSGLPDDAVVTAVEMLFRTAGLVSNLGSTSPVDFLAFTGDGTLQLSDEIASADLLASEMFTTGFSNNTPISVLATDLNPFNAVLTDGNPNDFLTLRSETVDFVTFSVDSIESTDPNAAAATLRITYNTAAVPEPGTCILLTSMAIGLSIRRRK